MLFLLQKKKNTEVFFIITTLKRSPRPRMFIEIAQYYLKKWDYISTLHCIFIEDCFLVFLFLFTEQQIRCYRINGSHLNTTKLNHPNAIKRQAFNP